MKRWSRVHGFEGAMTTQWRNETQGETNVEIALATSQDSRHTFHRTTHYDIPPWKPFFAFGYSLLTIGFFESIFDDGTIFEWKPDWIYDICVSVLTAFTVGSTWSIGVYRPRLYRNFPLERGGTRFRSLSLQETQEHRVPQHSVQDVS
ncbi:hypothetical protein CEK25_012391 [Fusarium fujikuroi]|nr:hypothetical protein CEK25_012391 [Fusarium fujikuroi]